MLIIGNGFDLAHGRPTTYADFLRFLDDILATKVYKKDKAHFEADLDVDCPIVREFISQSFDTRRIPGGGVTWNTNNVVQELYDCLDNNTWYEYFYSIYRANMIRGKSWIDFESEIREIIEFFDREIVDVYDKLPDRINELSNVTPKIATFCSKLNFFEYNNKRGIQSENTYFDLVEKTYQDLERLIRCLEIYLDDCIGKMPIQQFSPDIQGLEIHSALSFNYTAIPTDIYPSLPNPHHIHGFAKTDRPAAENNMVLGVNEYWEGEDKNTHTNFNLYKKFVQRIVKETGIDYKISLQEMLSEYNNSEFPNAKTKGDVGLRYNNVYIFGHSLDVTDGGILREVIQTPGVVTTIFYRNKQQQANQIANLSKVLTQDELLERTFSTSPTIIFKRQAEMVPR